MLQLLQLEFVKFKRSRYMHILIIVVGILICWYFYYQYQKEVTLQREKEIVQENVMISDLFLADVKKQIDEAEKNNSFIEPRIVDLYEVQLLSNAARKKILNGIETLDWQLFLEGAIEDSLESEKDAKRELEEVAKSFKYKTPFLRLTNIDRYRWMLDRNIQPIFPAYPSPYISIYDEEFDESMLEKNIRNLSNVYSTVGFNFTSDVMKYGFTLIGLVFFVFLFGDFLTKEGIGRNGPIQLIRTQPIKRWKFWLSKYITPVLGSTIIIIGFALLALLLGLVFNRLGDWDYPVLIYGEDRTYTFMPILLFVAKAFSLFLLFLFLAFSLLILFSIMTNRAIVAIALTCVTLVGGEILAEQSVLMSFSHFIPFHYFDIYHLLTGIQAIEMNNQLYSYNSAVISITFSTVIIWLITWLIGKFKKQLMNT